MSAGGVGTLRITLSPTPNTGPLQQSHIPLGSLWNCYDTIVFSMTSLRVYLAVSWSPYWNIVT